MVTYYQYDTRRGRLVEGSARYELALLHIRFSGNKPVNVGIRCTFARGPLISRDFNFFMRFRNWRQPYPGRGCFELTSINWSGAIPKPTPESPNPQPVWDKAMVRDLGMKLLQLNYPNMDYVPGRDRQLPMLLERKS